MCLVCGVWRMEFRPYPEWSNSYENLCCLNNKLYKYNLNIKSMLFMIQWSLWNQSEHLWENSLVLVAVRSVWLPSSYQHNNNFIIVQTVFILRGQMCTFVRINLSYLLISHPLRGNRKVAVNLPPIHPMFKML